MDNYQGQVCKYLSMYDSLSTLQLAVRIIDSVGVESFKCQSAKYHILQRNGIKFLFCR